MNELKRYFRIKGVPIVTICLIVANLIVYIVTEIIGDTTSAVFMFNHGAAYTPAIMEGHEYWRLFTCMFLHFGIRHFFNNMLVLGFLGDNLERALGKIKFLILYICSGFLANIVSVLVEYYGNDVVVSAGASGAIFGIVGALIWILIANRGVYEDLSIQRVFMFVIFSVFLGVQSSGIDNVAHIGGLIFGFILCMILYRKNKKSVEKNRNIW